MYELKPLEWEYLAKSNCRTSEHVPALGIHNEYYIRNVMTQSGIKLAVSIHTTTQNYIFELKNVDEGIKFVENWRNRWWKEGLGQLERLVLIKKE